MMAFHQEDELPKRERRVNEVLAPIRKELAGRPADEVLAALQAIAWPYDIHPSDLWLEVLAEEISSDKGGDEGPALSGPET
jgi:hypothetical protein